MKSFYGQCAIAIILLIAIIVAAVVWNHCQIEDIAARYGKISARDVPMTFDPEPSSTTPATSTPSIDIGTSPMPQGDK